MISEMSFLRFTYIPIYLMISAMTVSAVGCRHELLPPEVQTVQGITDPTDTILFSGIPCDPDSVYFENQILPLIISTCAQPGCHDAETAEDGVDLSNYWSIINTGEIDVNDPEDSELVEVITENDPDDVMPPPGEGSLSQEQIDVIISWIEQGALQNYCEACDTTLVTFSGAIQPLIQLKCQGCHSGTDPDGDLALLNYEDVAAIAADGRFSSSISGTDGYTQMPYNGNSLPECEIQVIETWINDGYENN